MIDYRKNNKWTVYIHIISKNITGYENDKYYVGITCKNPKDRWKSGNGYKGQCFEYAISKYGWDNIEHIIFSSSITKKEAERMEETLICKLNSNNKKFGYNRTNGGNAFNGMSYENNPNSVMVICLNTLEIFDSVSRANDWVGFKKGCSLISNFCNKTTKSPSVGKHPITKERLIWDYYEDGRKYVIKTPPEKNNHRTRPVICLSTMEEFKTITSACKKYGLSRTYMRKMIRLNKTYGLDENNVKLMWMYLEDYKKINQEEGVVID